MSSVVPSIAGPKRPQDKVLLTESAKLFYKVLKKIQKENFLKKKMFLEKILN